MTDVVLQSRKSTPVDIDHAAMWIVDNALVYWNNLVSANSFNYIYRGVYESPSEGGSELALVESGTGRKSANTTNIYTLITDHDEKWDNYPNRSESFIANTCNEMASGYGKSYVLIPKDSTKIGICSGADFWISFNESFKLYLSHHNLVGDLNDLNELIVHMIFVASANKKQHMFISEIYDILNSITNVDELYQLIDDAYDTVKLMIESKRTKFGNLISKINGSFDRCYEIFYDIIDFMKSTSDLKQTRLVSMREYSYYLERVIKFFDVLEQNDIKKFSDFLRDKIYDPTSNAFNCITGAEMSQHKSIIEKEVWLSGEVLFIDSDLAVKLFEKIDRKIRKISKMKSDSME